MKCPYCAEEIKPEAAKCRFCGEWMDQSEKNKRDLGNVANEVQQGLRQRKEADEGYGVIAFVSLAVGAVLWFYTSSPEAESWIPWVWAIAGFLATTFALIAIGSLPGWVHGPIGIGAGILIGVNFGPAYGIGGGLVVLFALYLISRAAQDTKANYSRLDRPDGMRQGQRNDNSPDDFWRGPWTK